MYSLWLERIAINNTANDNNTMIFIDIRLLNFIQATINTKTASARAKIIPLLLVRKTAKTRTPIKKKYKSLLTLLSLFGFNTLAIRTPIYTEP
jgi:hypothetical protein